MLNRYFDLIIAGGLTLSLTLGVSLGQTKLNLLSHGMDQQTSVLSKGARSYYISVHNQCLGTVRISTLAHDEATIFGKGHLILWSNKAHKPAPWELAITLQFNALSQLYSGEILLQSQINDSLLQIDLSKVKPIQASIAFTSGQSSVINDTFFEGPLWLSWNNEGTANFVSGLPLYRKPHHHLTEWWRTLDMAFTLTDEECKYEKNNFSEEELLSLFMISEKTNTESIDRQKL